MRSLVPHVGMNFRTFNEAGHFGLATMDRKVLRSGNGIQIKDHR